MVRLKQKARCPQEKGQQISAAIQEWARKRRLADQEEERKEAEEEEKEEKEEN